MDVIDPIPACVRGGPPAAFDPAWLTEAVCALAAGIDAERAFDRLPILADALQDAGCEDADILGHCRMCLRHAAGCWVVRGVLETHLPPTVTLVVAPPERVVEVAGRETWAAWLLAFGLLGALGLIARPDIGGATPPVPTTPASGGRQPPDSQPFENPNQGADATCSSGPQSIAETVSVAPRTTPVFVTTPLPVRPARPGLIRRLFRR